MADANCPHPIANGSPICLPLRACMLGDTLADWRAQLQQPASAQVGPLNWGVGPAHCPVQSMARRDEASAGADHRPRPGSFLFARPSSRQPPSPNAPAVGGVVGACGWPFPWCLAAAATRQPWLEAAQQPIGAVKYWPECGLRQGSARPWRGGAAGVGGNAATLIRIVDLPLGRGAGSRRRRGPGRPLRPAHGGFLVDSVVSPQARHQHS